MKPFWKRDSSPASFWEWLQSPEGEATVAGMRREPPHGPRAVDKVGKRFNRAFKDLAWDISGVGHLSVKQFEISGDGNPARINAVRAAVASAPEMPGWEVIAFRQPAPGFAIQYKGYVVSPKNVTCQALVEPGVRVNVRAFLPLPAYAPVKLLHEIGFLVLDHTLGEEIVMTRLGRLEFESMVSAPQGVMPLSELAEILFGEAA